ncbi:MAG: multiheme c-type cytochrome [Motiliproteus sp.]
MPQLLTLFLSLLLVSCATTAQNSLTLVYSGNLDGELEPCGCSLDADYGGISRRTTYVDGLRKESKNLVLISAGGLFSKELGGDTIKNRYILSGLEQLNYDAIGVQWADLIHGIDFLQQSPLPLTAANWRTDELPSSRIIERPQQQLFFTQWLDPETSPYKNMPALSPINADTAPLEQQLKQANDNAQLTILATTLDYQQLKQNIDLAAVDIVIIKSAYEQFSEPVEADGTLILQAGSRGQRLGKLQLSINAQGNLDSWSHEVIELHNEIADTPRLQSWYEAYNEELRTAFESEIKQMRALDQGETPYAGEQVCASCHQQAHDVWAGSEHAKAYEDLEIVGKAFDSHCVGCHVVGFKQPGGFLSIELTSTLAGVQCENCHGAGREHVQSAGVKQTPNHGMNKEQICTQCHIQEHSPNFQTDEYWPKILHSKEQSAQQ